jgi:twitching motility protein PilJ
MFKNLRLRTRIGLGFGLLVSLLAVTAVVSFFSLRALERSATGFLQEDARLADLALRAQVKVLELRRFEKDSFLNLDNEAALTDYLAKWSVQRNQLLELVDQVAAVAVHAEDRTVVESLRKDLAGYEKGFGDVAARLKEHAIGTPQQANAEITPTKVFIRRMEETAGAFAKRHSEGLQGAPATFAAQAARSAAVLGVLLLVAIGAGLGLSAFISTLISRAIMNPLLESVGGAAAVAAGQEGPEDEIGQMTNAIGIIRRNLEETRRLKEQVERDNADLQTNIMSLLVVVSDASEGNLTVRAPITAGALGNVGDAFNSLLESQQALLGQVKDQILKTDEAVERLGGAARQMAGDATSQSKQVVAATGLVSRISEEIGQVSQIAQQAAEAAKRTEASALEGESAVNDVITGMSSLRGNVQAGAKKMKGLGDRSMEITGIVGTISRISEQTNMLALNAAIEAARAGEQGRGFSVVAEEVRKLAERAAGATREIDKLVKAIHVETSATISAIEQQTQVVEHESTLVSQAGASLSRIREVSSQSAGIVVDISAVAQRQVAGTGEIVRTMAQISEIARTTQRGAEQTVSQLDALAAMSNALRQRVDRLKLA